MCAGIFLKLLRSSTSSVIEPVQQASTTGMTPLNVVFVGLILVGEANLRRSPRRLCDTDCVGVLVGIWVGDEAVI